MKIEKFGEDATLYTLDNQKGLILKLTDIGASITGIFFKDKHGKDVQVSFGSDENSFYKMPHDYIGSSVGRVCGRTIKGEFYIGDKKYSLAKNNGENHLHGGVKGLSFQKFESKYIDLPDEMSVSFSYQSKDGEEGYPGNLDVTITYTLTENNEIIINYHAKTDAVTPLNLTNHAYWNLNGEGKIYDHEVFIDAPFYLPIDKDCISTGEILFTKNTPFDFTKTKKIGKDIEKAGGYDNCFVFNDTDINKLKAKVFSQKTSIALEIFTTMPSVQFYTGNMLKGIKVRNGILNKHDAFCLETEYFPCSMNYSHFPSILLYPDREYHHKTIHKLSIIN